ncbi:MAG: metalloregulator ArsR/SmtB family transcription factor [Phycisphaerales bacterium]|nr:metalloregulator ArsR/SmtB family transcription factor [Phycisphaerales bacterium]
MPCSSHSGGEKQSPPGFHQPTSGDPLDSDEQVAYYFALLAGQVRMRILRQLALGPSSVSDLANELRVSIALISHNLQKLFQARLVQVRPRARKRMYRLDGNFAQSVDGCLHLNIPLGPKWRAEIAAPHCGSQSHSKGIAKILPEAVDRLLQAPLSPNPATPRHRTGGHSPRRSPEF